MDPITKEIIDDVLKSLEELEDQRYLSVTAKNQIQTLKFELRYLRLHVKWDTYFDPSVRQNVRNWVKDVEMRLLQPTREGRLATELLEETLSGLLQSKELEHWNKENSEKCLGYFEDQWYGRKFAYEDVMIDELVLEWIDPLLENFKHLIHFDDLNLLVSPKEQIEALMDNLRTLREFLENSGMELKELIKNFSLSQGLLNKTSEDLLTRIVMLIENAIYLSYDSWSQREQERMEKLLFALLVKMNHIEPEIRMIYLQLLKASKIANPGTLEIDLQALAAVDSLLDNIQELLKDQHIDSCMPLDIHQIEFLHQELSFLKYFLMDPHLKQDNETHRQSFISLLIQVEAIAREAGSLTSSICVGETVDHMADEINLLHSDLPKILKLLKAEIIQMYLRIQKSSSFPQTPKLGFLDFFLQGLDELLKHRADSIAYVKNEIEIVKSELGCLSYLSDTIMKYEEDGHIARRVVDVAYEAERVIDLISATTFPRWYYMLWLFDVIEKIKMLRKDYNEVCSKETFDVSVVNVKKVSTHRPAWAYTLAAEEVMVGFNDEAERIIDQLIRGSPYLDIVSIVGMPGIGKTTLAKKVYQHPLVSHYFHVCSWCCISQAYDKRELLLSILSHIIELTDGIFTLTYEDLELKLYQILKGRRYLIVLDDIWSVEPWHDIRISFPDDSNGSRIVFTTRNREVSLQVNSASHLHDLRLFTDEESWELLQIKVFGHRSCPSELYGIGKQIAENCKGLPLSVVIIAGLLIRLEISEDNWRQVSENMGKQIVGDSIGWTDILELSYKHLPEELKPCFLYLGAFPEGKEIPTWKLIRLWIAEGLVQKSESKNLESVAEDYLTDLIGRSLVSIAKNKSNGRVKSCHVHDIFHEFCLIKAKDENFLRISKEMVKSDQYRHSFYCKQTSLHGGMPYDPYPRSVLFFPTETAEGFFYDLHPVDLSILPYIMKLLRVLDLEHVPLSRSKFPSEVKLLVHLRYLAVRGEMNRIPSSVGNLWRLETLIVKGTSGKVRLPETLLQMAYLKYVLVNDRAAFDLPETFRLEKSFESGGIEKLCTPSLRHGDGTTEKVTRMLRNLRKLKCIFLESWDYSRRCNRFPVLDLLSELESLNVTYSGTVKVPCEFSFPSNLKKLTLSKFRLPWSEISMIGRLPQLEVLKLVSRAFEGRRWDVSDDEFLRLKFLQLQSLNIVEWDTSEFAFPCLEHLVVQNCKQLVEIPPSFVDINTLGTIEVHWCNYSVNKAACKIQETRLDDWGDELKVVIQPPDWDSAADP